MSDYAISITHERDDDSGKWFYQCVITNATETERHPQSVAVGLLDGIGGKTLEEASQTIETLQPGEAAVLTYMPRAEWKFKQFMRVTVAGEAREFLVCGHNSDPVIDSKVRRSSSHAIGFIKRHALSLSVAVVVAASLTAFSTLASEKTIEKASEGLGMGFLSIELAWVVFGFPLLVYLGWMLISSQMASQASTTTAYGTMSGGTINLTVYEGSATNAAYYREVMGTGRPSAHRKVFFFGFCLNASIIAYQLLHGVMKGEKSVFSGIMSCSLFLTSHSIEVFFGVKPVIDTGLKNVNLILALVDYALIIAIPIALLKLTKEHVVFQKKVVTVFWGVFFGLLIAQVPALIGWLGAK
jgi:hypothetical protein